MIMQSRFFHSTKSLQVWYEVNGERKTLQELLSIAPEERTVADWQPLIDWDLQKRKPYVVIDPLDTSNLLYLTWSEYLSVVRTFVNNNVTPTMLAHPKSKRPTQYDRASSSQNSPLYWWESGRWTRASRYAWKHFLDLGGRSRRFVSFAKGSKMVSVTSETLDRTLYMWAQECLHYNGVKVSLVGLQHFVPLVTYLTYLLKHNGALTVTQVMKIHLYCLYSYLAGNPVSSTVPLGHGTRLRKGLPKSWGVTLRSLVRQNNLNYIRVVASVLNLYRAMFAGMKQPDVSSIVKPHPTLSGEIWEEFKAFASGIFPRYIAEKAGYPAGRLPRFKYKTGLGLFPRTAGPNVSGAAFGSLILDAKAWMARGQDNHVLRWFLLNGDNTMASLLRLLSIEDHWGPQGLGIGVMANRWPPQMYKRTNEGDQPLVPLDRDGNPVPILGRLHAINEPAGKVRVVAITDYFTQVALSPVHKFIFKILELLRENDATFDQDGTTQAYFEKGLSPHWSFDLKAATDSIPIALYREVMTPLFGVDELGRAKATLWIKILTDRDWLSPSRDGRMYKYGTGQPMGALSSWASMALVHHAILQFAHYRVKGLKWFTDYLILGDDIDIATSKDVADSYKEVCAAFSIPIGLAKSLQSDSNCFEFANRRFTPQGDVSPASFKEELQATNWTSRLEFARRLQNRWGPKSPDQGAALLRKATTATQWLQIVPEASGLRPKRLLALLRHCLEVPFFREEGKAPSISDLWKWLASIGDPVAVQGLTPLLSEERVRAQLEWEFIELLWHRMSDRYDTLLREFPSGDLSDLMNNTVPNVPENWAKRAELLSKVGVPDTSPFEEIENCLSAHHGDIGSLRRTVYRRLLAHFEDMVGTFKSLNGKPITILPTHTLKGAPMAFIYIIWCIAVSNGKAFESAYYGKFYPEEAGLLQDMSVASRSVSPPEHILRTMLERWAECNSLPAYTRLNPIIGLNYSVQFVVHDDYAYDPVNMRLSEHTLTALKKRNYLAGPLQELYVAFARKLGILLPQVYLFNQAKMGSNWIRAVYQRIRESRKLMFTGPLALCYKMALAYHANSSKLEPFLPKEGAPGPLATSASAGSDEHKSSTDEGGSVAPSSSKPEVDLLGGLLELK